MSVTCHSCGNFFEDYTELARHIAGSTKGHRKGKKWAAQLLLRVKQLDKKAEFQERIENRTPLSEEDKQARRSNKLELSGVKKMMNTQCPHCKTLHVETVEVEHTQSTLAWKTPKGTLLILCARCRR
jgi:hypothetical protein